MSAQMFHLPSALIHCFTVYLLLRFLEFFLLNTRVFGPWDSIPTYFLLCFAFRPWVSAVIIYRLLKGCQRLID